MYGVAFRTWTEAGGPSWEAMGASHFADGKDPCRLQGPAGRFQSFPMQLEMCVAEAPCAVMGQWDTFGHLLLDPGS